MYAPPHRQRHSHSHGMNYGYHEFHVTSEQQRGGTENTEAAGSQKKRADYEKQTQRGKDYTPERPLSVRSSTNLNQRLRRKEGGKEGRIGRIGRIGSRKNKTKATITTND